MQEGEEKERALRPEHIPEETVAGPLKYASTYSRRGIPKYPTLFGEYTSARSELHIS